MPSTAICETIYTVKVNKCRIAGAWGWSGAVLTSDSYGERNSDSDSYAERNSDLDSE
jgi:hypothetical protein